MTPAAFPTIEGHSDFRGMELRDYFAAAAAPALVDRAEKHVAIHGRYRAGSKEIAEQTAKWAYLLADAMMEARKEKQ